MKRLTEYLTESEQWVNTPAEGDSFAFELPDEVLCETYIIEVADDCILLDSTPEINAALKEWATLEDTDEGESGVILETMGYGTLVGEEVCDECGMYESKCDCEKRAFECEVRRVVVEQQPRRDAGHQGDADRGRENQSVRPSAALEDQDPPEAMIPGEHRREHRHHGELDDQGREEELLRGEEFGFLEHSPPIVAGQGLGISRRPSYHQRHDWTAA